MDNTAETARLLQDRKLEQACPRCGRWEAAGSFCSGCLMRTGPQHWYLNGQLEGRAAARQIAPQKSQTGGNGRRGRPRRASGQEATNA